ncbi:unnamed protein product [Ilex paraguariensis]|uniref:Uncharacterized protein n=1 Tax=Ilex paraguariensis TaxID=185542 RepID=A0ABC8QZU8_9AQUA
MDPHACTSLSHSVGGNVRNDSVVITNPIPALNSIDGSSNGGIVPVITNALPKGTLNDPLSTTTYDLVVETPQYQEKSVKIAGSWSQVVKHGKDAAQQSQIGNCPRMNFNNTGIPKEVLQHKSKGDKGKEISEISALNESSLMKEQTETLNNLQLAECSGSPSSFAIPANGTLSTIL